MGRLLFKCATCGSYFATGLNIASKHDPRRLHKFRNIPYVCTECGAEREYSSDELVDEGPEVGSKAKRKPTKP